MAATFDPVALGVDPRTLAASAANVACGRTTLLAMSGKLASGKDAVGAAVLAALGRREAVRLAFGAAICAEGDRILEAIAAARGPAAAATAVADELGVTPVEAAHTVELLWDAVGRDGLRTTLVRHPAVRPALQHWGGIRRRGDRLYWIRPLVAAAVAHSAAGTSCLLADVRTPEEAAWARAVGFLLVRIDVTEETQRRRLAARDDIPWNADASRSWTETALDAGGVFDLRVDNDVDADDADNPAVRAIVAAVCARAAA